MASRFLMQRRSACVEIYVFVVCSVLFRNLILDSKFLRRKRKNYTRQYFFKLFYKPKFQGQAE